MDAFEIIDEMLAVLEKICEQADLPEHLKAEAENVLREAKGEIS